MNPVLEVIFKRRSVRAYDPKEIPTEAKNEIIGAALRAPTAGGMMLYTVIEVVDQKIKDTLAKSCDDQPFIAKAPWVLLFLADYQRWFEFFKSSGVPRECEKTRTAMRKPEEGDLFLACCDAIIAAQTAVIAAESLGIGSCYIGDIMENYEVHKKLFSLPPYVFPICLICFGYPTKDQLERALVPRFDRKFIVFENQYKQLDQEAFEEMFHLERTSQAAERVGGVSSLVQQHYDRRFNADFSK